MGLEQMCEGTEYIFLSNRLEAIVKSNLLEFEVTCCSEIQGIYLIRGIYVYELFFRDGYRVTATRHFRWRGYFSPKM